MEKNLKKQRFSIRKYTFGAGSVLIGLSLSFVVHTTKVEAAETVTNVQTNIGHKSDVNNNVDTDSTNKNSENEQVNTENPTTQTSDNASENKPQQSANKTNLNQDANQLKNSESIPEKQNVEDAQVAENANATKTVEKPVTESSKKEEPTEELSLIHI